jgi:4-hydroxyphenylpyruvate dioxygenase
MKQTMPPITATGGAGDAAVAVTPEHTARRFPLVVRVNPRSDCFPVLAFHHVEFWCADAASAAGRFAFSLGAPLAARSDLSTGNSAHASLLLRSGALAFLFTAPYAPPPEDSAAAAATASLPSFSADAARTFASSQWRTQRHLEAWANYKFIGLRC